MQSKASFMNKPFVLCSLLFFASSVGAINLPLQNLFVSLVERSGMPASDVTVEQALQRVSVKMNQYLPSEVDKETRLDKISAEPGRQLTYHYTLLNMKSSDINRAKFTSTLQPLLKLRLCTDNEMKNFLRNGVNVMYVYRAVDIQPVASFKYTPADCGHIK